MDDVDYKWRSGNNKGIEIVSSKMAQFDLLRYETSNDASINSKGKRYSGNEFGVPFRGKEALWGRG